MGWVRAESVVQGRETGNVWEGGGRVGRGGLKDGLGRAECR